MEENKKKTGKKIDINAIFIVLFSAIVFIGVIYALKDDILQKWFNSTSSTNTTISALNNTIDSNNTISIEQDVKEDIEESKENLSNIKGYDLIYNISKYVGKDYKLKSDKETKTEKYDIYIEQKYDISMKVETGSGKVLEMMLITYENDIEFIKFADELFLDKTQIDNWILENYQKEEEITVFEGYEFNIGTTSGITELSVVLNDTISAE